MNAHAVHLNEARAFSMMQPIGMRLPIERTRALDSVRRHRQRQSTCEPVTFLHVTCARLPSFNLDPITHQPKLNLLEARLPTTFEILHPAPIFNRIGRINDESHQIIAIENATMPPMPFNLLRLV